MSTIDLNQPPPNHEYKVTIEREETRAERTVRLGKDIALFATGLAFVALIAWLCIDTLRSPTSGAEEKKWAMSFLSAAAGGIIGYLVRK